MQNLTTSINTVRDDRMVSSTPPNPQIFQEAMMRDSGKYLAAKQLMRRESNCGTADITELSWNIRAQRNLRGLVISTLYLAIGHFFPLKGNLRGESNIHHRRKRNCSG